MFTPLHSSINQELFEKYICNHMKRKKYDGAACPSDYLKLKYPLPFSVSYMYSMFNLLHSSANQELFEKHLCDQGSHYEKHSMPKGTSWAEATSNSEIFKPVALAVIELR